MSADTARRMPHDAGLVPMFVAPYAPPDEEIARQLLTAAERDPKAEKRIDAQATRLVQAIRAKTGGLGGIEDFLREYSLSTKEGLALMVLAEALLRVPDAVTADRLIEDKLAAADWAGHEAKSSALLVSASAWALGISARIIQPGETPETILENLGKRLGLPAVRAATRQAMRLLGAHFVSRADDRRKRSNARPPTASFATRSTCWAKAPAPPRMPSATSPPMRTRSRRSAARRAMPRCPERPGISVKLSALHPRYEAISRERVLAELTPRVVELARAAKAHDLNFTVDAEEADRLELSLEVVRRVLAEPALAGWDGFGLAVQAYQKRAPQVIDWLQRGRGGARSPPDGPARQGRLLGHRGQARAGTRATRLSGVHPQADDRPVLPRLRAQAARGAGRVSIRNSRPTTRSPSRP